jgi:hypothetical protein
LAHREEQGREKDEMSQVVEQHFDPYLKERIKQFAAY